MGDKKGDKEQAGEAEPLDRRATGSEAAKRRKLIRTTHPGVKLLKRSWGDGKQAWAARWRDPVNGKWIQQALDPLDLTTKEARRAWAITKSQEIARDRAALAAGVILPQAAGITIESAILDYLTNGTNRLRPRTVAGYRKDLADFAAFCKGLGVVRLDRLMVPHLVRYREAVASRSKIEPVRGGRRHERRAGDRPRAAPTCNRALRAVATYLFHVRRLGLTPKLDRDGITDGLKRLSEPRPRPAILHPPELRKLLEACLRHDAATFAMTRAEKDGLKLAGSTPRYQPVAPLMLAALLSGCRLGELLSLRWEHVHLNPPDRGELIVTATASKTRAERAVTLEESPSLVRLLAALKLKSGGAPFVFGDKEPMVEAAAQAARKRLASDFGAPSFSFQNLRQTCGSYLANAPGIYGGGAAYRESKRLGHGVLVAERNYVGLVRDIPKDAATLEAAMRIENLAERIVRAASGGTMRPAAEAQGRREANA